MNLRRLYIDPLLLSPFYNPLALLLLLSRIDYPQSSHLFLWDFYLRCGSTFTNTLQLQNTNDTKLENYVVWFPIQYQGDESRICGVGGFPSLNTLDK